MECIEPDLQVLVGALTASVLRSAEDVDVAFKEAVVKYLEQHKFTQVTNGEAVMFADIIVDLFASIHIIDMNKHKSFLSLH